jgi:DNA modification methylase
MSETPVFQKLAHEFREWLQVDWSIPDDLRKEGKEMTSSLGKEPLRETNRRKEELFALVSSKLRYNKGRVKKLIDSIAEHRVYFSKPKKDRIRDFFDRRDEKGFRDWVRSLDISPPLRETMIGLFDPLTEEELLSELHSDLESKSDRKAQKILRAIFGGFVSCCFDREEVHKYFNDRCTDRYFEDFFDHLKFFYEESLDRSKTLSLLTIDDSLFERFSSEYDFFDTIISFVRGQYQSISNHCFLAIYIQTGDLVDESIRWKIYSKLSLYAENLDQYKLDKKYFRSEEIKEKTKNHIDEIDLEKAKFEEVNEGFHYEDCFVVNKDKYKYNTLLLFQKHVRDETVIPCPSCRSKNISGNSYPDLGVRSWECKNPLCPDKSKSDRGKRYSLRSLIQREAIDKEENQIPDESLEQWRLDVASVESDHEVLDLLLRHYTLHGDTVALYNINLSEDERYGRHFEHKSLPDPDIGTTKEFLESAFFNRYIYEKKDRGETPNYEDISDYEGLKVFCGKAYKVLKSLNTESIDGAITSPPYYNAKKYSVWPNIYTYLYDMYNVAIEMNRVLKNKSLFLYNIFDYFDNENNIALSAMGDKRIALGAYTIDIFERAGFNLIDNIIWHKGEIEGTRNYNQGNKSPYYQDPHNCYEHIFIFSKGNIKREEIEYPSIFKNKPVFKYKNGENVLGHEAPFPEDIPNLLLDMIDNDNPTVLDPFAGVLTTGRAAYKRNIQSINIDYKKEYCERGLNILAQQLGEPSLFVNS